MSKNRPIFSAGIIAALFYLLAFSLPQTLPAHSLFVSAGAPEAAVTLDSTALGQTDQSGILFHEPVKAGYHLLKIEKQGYRTRLDTIFVPAGLTYNQILPLEPLQVMVVNEQTGAKVDSVGGPYTLQLGAFHEMDNARRLAERTGGAGAEVRIETAQVEKVGMVHRVRTGTFDSLETARRAALGYLQEGTEEVWVVGLDGIDWAIQLGAYSTRRDAENLAVRLARPGIYVWVEDSADNLFKVKAGYWPDRDSAQRAAQSLGDQSGEKAFAIQIR
ncbi:MAG TPA: SPOR domain-containing protein [Candidatus Glassbacteria bacterium]|nr:SPOR domain-containing protein [Candidatus Glassbacteria bacterium]